MCNFRDRGINLRASYPKIYTDLCRYVEEGKSFAPVCLFPRDLNKNNLFMCLIMPNSDPANYSWFYDYEQKLEMEDEKNEPESGSGSQNQMPKKVRFDPGSFVLSNYMCIV